jgi:hypothetical protein
MNGVVDVIDIQRILLPRNRTNFNSLAITLILQGDMNFQADVTVTLSVVTTAASPVIPTQQTIHPMTPIVEPRLLRRLTSLNTKMQTLLFLILQMLRNCLHLIVVGVAVTILVLDVMQKPPQFVRQTNSEP